MLRPVFLAGNATTSQSGDSGGVIDFNHPSYGVVAGAVVLGLVFVAVGSCFFRYGLRKFQTKNKTESRKLKLLSLDDATINGGGSTIASENDSAVSEIGDFQVADIEMGSALPPMMKRGNKSSNEIGHDNSRDSTIPYYMRSSSALENNDNELSSRKDSLVNFFESIPLPGGKYRDTDDDTVGNSSYSSGFARPQSMESVLSAGAGLISGFFSGRFSLRKSQNPDNGEDGPNLTSYTENTGKVSYGDFSQASRFSLSLIGKASKSFSLFGTTTKASHQGDIKKFNSDNCMVSTEKVKELELRSKKKSVQKLRFEENKINLPPLPPARPTEYYAKRPLPQLPFLKPEYEDDDSLISFNIRNDDSGYMNLRTHTTSSDMNDSIWITTKIDIEFPVEHLYEIK
jgi:hypothetical protein